RGGRGGRKLDSDPTPTPTPTPFPPSTCTNSFGDSGRRKRKRPLVTYSLRNQKRCRMTQARTRRASSHVGGGQSRGLETAKSELSRPTKWLTGFTIDLLVSHILSTSSDDVAACSALTLQVDNEPSNHWPRKSLPRKNYGYSVIYMPVVNRKPKHWSLAVLRQSSKEGRTDFYYHSSGCKDRTRRVTAAFSLLDGNGVEVKQRKCPQQHDGYNCGIFVVCMIEHLHAGSKVTKGLRFNLADERKRWLDVVDSMSVGQISDDEARLPEESDPESHESPVELGTPEATKLSEIKHGPVLKEFQQSKRASTFWTCPEFNNLNQTDSPPIFNDLHH
ncbi:hypothetical protein FSARC_14888, partial [Fusarium sarcochroum]